MKHCKKLFIFFLLAFFLLLTSPKAILGYGETALPPTCTAFKPPAPSLYYIETIGNDKVRLVWDQNPLASSWTIAYGPEAGRYIWGLDRFGNYDSRSIIISDLPRGTFYFVVRANNGCMPGPFSNEQSIQVGTTEDGYTPPTYWQPTTTPTPSPTPEEEVPTVSHQELASPKPALLSPPPTPSPAPSPSPKPGFFKKITNFFKKIIDFFLGLFN